MERPKSSLKMSSETIRFVESILMNNACDCIAGLREVRESKNTSIEDCEALISLNLHVKYDLVHILRMIGFFDDNNRKSIFKKGGKRK